MIIAIIVLSLILILAINEILSLRNQREHFIKVAENCLQELKKHNLL